MSLKQEVPQIIIDEIIAEVARAQAKFPDWPTDIIHAAAIVGEESGELTQAALQWTYESGKLSEAKKEAVQVACTAIRFLIGLGNFHYESNPTM